VVQVAAYVSGERLLDHYYGRLHDSSHRTDVVFSQILLPPDAPRELADRQTLWTEVDRSEKRADAQTAREFQFSVAKELSHDEQNALIGSSIAEFFVSNERYRGMCADWSLHDKGDGNPHVHLLLTTRPVDSNGFCAKKNRSWNEKSLVRDWREYWEKAQNKALASKGLKIELSHESYHVQRRYNETPSKFLSPKVKALYERDGIVTERMDEYLAIEKKREMEAQEREQEMESQQSQELDFERSY
jgi:ATP-dependent exoDNAse (exonuclease V) alpha subunit